MQSGYALDLISLLLSKSTPRQAEISMSPFLRQEVPMGTLGAEVLQQTQITESRRLKDRMVSTGWKLQSLNATADSVLQSATRLEKEIEQEAKYWEQVLAVKEKGWSLSRLPREKHTLGVRYGFAEGKRYTRPGLLILMHFPAAPEFRDRGLAALRRGEGGAVDLDLGLNAPARHVLRSQLVSHGQVIASSTKAFSTHIPDNSVESMILEARNHIFDEELYHELLREARKMTNRGIQCTTDSIVLSLGEDRQILIGLVPPESLESDEIAKSRQLAWQDAHLPDIIVSSLRILLCHAHRGNMKHRSQVPPPLTERKQPRSLYAILRPILAVLQHQSALKGLCNLLDKLRTILSHADVILEVDKKQTAFDAIKTISQKVNSDPSTAEALVELFLSPLLSVIHISLPTPALGLDIHVRTQSIQGTEYRVNSVNPPGSVPAQLRTESVFMTTQEVEDHVLHLLMMELVSKISSELKSWEVSAFHDGELRTQPDQEGRQQTVSLSLTSNRLRMTWSSTGGKLEDFTKIYDWTASPSKSKGLLAVIRDIDSGNTSKRPRLASSVS